MSERRCELGDGASTTLEIWGETGPLVLCVHGMTSSRKSWQRLATALSGTYRVAAYDQRGHGDSAGVDGMSLARAERDLHDVASELGEPIRAFVGHSWGGAVVLRAGLHGDVARVIAIDPMIRQVDDAWYDEYLDELRQTFAFVGAERDARTREEHADWSHDDVEGKVHAVHAMTTAPIGGLRVENPPETWDLRATIASYDRPLMLALPARGEGINAAETVDDVLAHTPAPLRVEWFPGQGHNLHRTDFDEFVRRTLAFIA